MSQDTYLAATLLMFMTFLVVVGTSVADLLLVILDPRIKLEKETEPG
jgi:peptide/nickel transport system permease protein